MSLKIASMTSIFFNCRTVSLTDRLVISRSELFVCVEMLFKESWSASCLLAKYASRNLICFIALAITVAASVAALSDEQIQALDEVDCIEQRRLALQGTRLITANTPVSYKMELVSADAARLKREITLARSRAHRCKLIQKYGQQVQRSWG